ncbi:MAG: hypothetical protein RLZZ104_2035, partial [Pseudomonadota bacterium]
MTIANSIRSAVTAWSKSVFIVHCPVDRPDLAAAFATLAGVDGWQQVFTATDRETGEHALVIFDAAVAA